MPRRKLIGYLQLTKFIQLSINEPLQEEIILHSPLNRCTITDYFGPVKLPSKVIVRFEGIKPNLTGWGSTFCGKTMSIFAS